MNRGARFLLAAAIAGALPVGAMGRASPGASGPLPEAANDVAAIDRRIAEIEAREAANRTTLAGLGQRLAIAHARVVSRGKAFYRLTRAGLLPVGGGFAALVSHAMHVERARRVLASNIDAESRLRGEAADLARDLERASRDRAALDGQRAAMDSARSASQDQARRQVAFERAFEASSGTPGGYVPVYGGSALGPDTPAGGFATARGRLLMPVGSRADVNAVRREGSDGPGIELRVPAGTAVRAVFAGRVAFADRYGPYGRIVIIDHGDHYFTVSGNLDQVDVKIGQELSGGDRVGTVGDDGRGSMLYFEVRHGSHTLAPQPWLGL